MRHIVFRKEAEIDLRGIISYYEDVAPSSINNILDDLYRSINLLVQFPYIGAAVPGRHFRRIITVKYHFKMAYEVDENKVIILGIFRYQDREV